MALNVIQARTEYDTRFGYGARGSKEVVEMLEDKVAPGSDIFAEIGLTCSYNIRGGKSEYASIAFWSEEEKFLQAIENSTPSSIIYGPASNTVQQMTEVLGAPEIQRYLARYYEETKVGSYTVWFKKENGGL
jgi:hypothetical protein